MKVFVISCNGYIHSIHTNKAIAEEIAEKASMVAAMGGSHDGYTVTEMEVIEDEKN